MGDVNLEVLCTKVKNVHDLFLDVSIHYKIMLSVFKEKRRRRREKKY